MFGHAGGRLRRLLADKRGAIAPMFAVALVPLIVVAGVGVDISRGMSSRNNLQEALDATGLAIAHLPPSTSVADVKTKAQAWLNANLTDGNLGTINLTVTKSTGQLALTATSSVKATLTGLAGVSTIPVSAATTVKWGLSHVEIALVLDNTGSMAGTKIQTLITAAKDLVDTLQESSQNSEPDALKISVVPFSMTVNVGASYQGQSWLSGVMPSQYGASIFNGTNNFNRATSDRFALFGYLGKPWGGCVENRPQPYDVQDTPPTSGTPATLFTPFFAPDEPGNRNSGSYPNDYLDDVLDQIDSNANWSDRQGYTEKYSTVWGCVEYKRNGRDCKTEGWVQGTPTVRSGTSSSGYTYGPNAGCQLTPLLRLTTDVDAVKTKLGQMVAIGDTNIPMGLVWGWHTLTPSAPFGDGTAYDTVGVKKIIVLLTDGENTMGTNNNNNASVYNGNGYVWQGRLGITSGSASTRTTKMDDRMTLLCNNIKAKDITIYTVRIDLSGTAPTALSGCPNRPEYFYDVPDVGDLSAAFEAIAGQIGDLRIAK